MLVHVAMLGLGVHAVRQWQREHPPSRPPDTPAAFKVRHLIAPAGVPPATETDEPPPASAEAPGPETQPPPPGPPAVGVVEPTFYVPRAQLSVAPVPRAPVLLQWPDNWPVQKSYSAVLKLYLDEQGRVERVEPDGDAVLPTPLLETARQAFLAASFTPGELNGQAVKSWMRIEVNFETGKIPAPP
ncbi:MAG TPA: hypothetical protein VIN03_11285 [Roseateles sp.]